MLLFEVMLFTKLLRSKFQEPHKVLVTTPPPPLLLCFVSIPKNDPCGEFCHSIEFQLGPTQVMVIVGLVLQTLSLYQMIFSQVVSFKFKQHVHAKIRTRSGVL